MRLKIKGTDIYIEKGMRVKVVQGVNKGKFVKIDGIAEPCEDYPLGRVIFNLGKSGLKGYMYYVPQVINAEWVSENGN